jgi:hypothetical protein
MGIYSRMEKQGHQRWRILQGGSSQSTHLQGGSATEEIAKGELAMGVARQDN